MKRYLGIFILTVVVGLSGCASDTDSDTQVKSTVESNLYGCPISI